ncbi:MAG: bifunctional oligoribonuclease/PAP phosphatase NrnA [Deltaproteobacteria bacterium]|nr:bifunctional oligoribonuclease/PAP phosphatase NrnA [Deltaproteobacteria bacterium]
MFEQELERAVKKIKESVSFLLTCHVGPDADALGSVLAMGLALKEIGKNVDWYNQDGSPSSLSFLPYVHQVKNSLELSKNYDVVITGDSGDIERLGKKFLGYKNYKCLINVDHHLTNTEFGDINVIDINAPSTGAVMLEIIKKLPVKVTADIAKAVYVTLVTDTGSFQYRNTTKEAFELAGEMVGLGANPGDISEELYFSFPPAKVLLLKRVLDTLEFALDQRYASIVLHEKDLKEVNASREVAEDFIDLPRSIKPVRVAAFFKEISKNKYKLSLRSKNKDVDVSKICGYFGGGGHYSASGCTLEGSLDKVKKEVFEQVQKALIPKK